MPFQDNELRETTRRLAYAMANQQPYARGRGWRRLEAAIDIELAASRRSALAEAADYLESVGLSAVAENVRKLDASNG